VTTIHRSEARKRRSLILIEHDAVILIQPGGLHTVPAEVYQDTTRCDSLAPTPRTMPVDVDEDVEGASAATAVDTPPLNTVAATMAARLVPTAAWSRTDPGACLHRESFIKFRPVGYQWY